MRTFIAHNTQRPTVSTGMCSSVQWILTSYVHSTTTAPISQMMLAHPIIANN